jgi:cytochrome c553
MRRLKLLLLLLLSVLGCQPSGEHKPVPVAPTTHGKAISYDDVRPVFARNCAACHPSRSGPDWLDYSQAKPYVSNGLLYDYAVKDKIMPPKNSPQAAAMSESDRQAIGAWVQAGGPEHGEAAAAPPAATAEGRAVSHEVQQCLQCHGAQSPNAQVQPKIPRLNGQNEIYLLAQLEDFRWRRRVDPSNTMNDIATGLSDAGRAEAAHYYSQLSGLAPPEPENPASTPAWKHGQALAEQRCNSCHMSPGASDPALPVLAGQAPQYLIDQLLYFRNGERGNPLMNEFARVLSDDDISDLALYYSAVRTVSKSKP